MLLRTGLLALSLIAISVPAFAACGPADLQAKALKLDQLVKAIAAKNPSVASEWKAKQIQADNVASSPADPDTMCATYDKAINDAQQVAQ